jgi:hypothetical protein
MRILIEVDGKIVASQDIEGGIKFQKELKAMIRQIVAEEIAKYPPRPAPPPGVGYRRSPGQRVDIKC